ncbi:hypothetical protein WICPIJ_009216 [Wickerhamomyces pijperi]|uniref:Uncharacterized protein n=1 Tax=Wickerhamomyces pijperi TaxID=599730 RepID=A0A9P8PQN4_WICPI|nr:hypothetical protein WICPIJ_009216 [Wickerhamomyces pijperi]
MAGAKEEPLMMSRMYLIPKFKLTALFNSILTELSVFSRSTAGFKITSPSPISPLTWNLMVSLVTRMAKESEIWERSLTVFWNSLAGKVMRESCSMSSMLKESGESSAIKVKESLAFPVFNTLLKLDMSIPKVILLSHL